MTMFVSDLPNLHQFGNENCIKLLETMAETENPELFENASLRAIVERAFPVVRNVVIKKLFVPYILFVMMFMIYSTYTYEELAGIEASLNQEGLSEAQIAELQAEEEYFSNIKQISKVIVLVLAAYFIFSEVVQIGL